MECWEDSIRNAPPVRHHSNTPLGEQLTNRAKIIVWLLIAFYLATVSVASAQQLAKIITRIGFLSAGGSPNTTHTVAF
jgi:hypothetical protein